MTTWEDGERPCDGSARDCTSYQSYLCEQGCRQDVNEALDIWADPSELCEENRCQALTRCGPIRGVLEGDACVFRGIPYAQPPVGVRRFKPPLEPACSGEMLEAREFKAACPQPMKDAQGNVVAVMGEEDCLYLNVWVPEGTTSLSALPVLFFIHGGGNISGSASEALDGVAMYDGGRLARASGALVVTINYRLGTLGFLTHPALSEANFGIRDQVAALEWVRANIRGFGGDYTRVLLFGQSAGALDVCVLLASGLAGGLFSTAAMHSGQCLALPADRARAYGEEWVAASGCDQAADIPDCLRSLPVLAILQTLPEQSGDFYSAWRYTPAVDGQVLEASPLDVIAAGDHRPVPLIVGATSDEASPDFGESTLDDFLAILQQAGIEDPGQIDQVRAMYPVGAGAGEYPTYREALIAVATDVKFICQSRLTARAAAGQGWPVFGYLFTHALANDPALHDLGAWHGLDLAFLFMREPAPGYEFTSGEETFSILLAGYWERLARTADPNGSGAATWPGYRSDTDTYLELDLTPSPAEGLRTPQCDLWDTLRPYPFY